jgi:hypothetical protein
LKKRCKELIYKINKQYNNEKRVERRAKTKKKAMKKLKYTNKFFL